MNRREFLRTSAAMAAVCAGGAVSAENAVDVPRVELPHYRGFNLLEKFTAPRSAPYREEDFEIVREWGFNFVRLPMSYLCWSDPAEPRKLDEKRLSEVDQAVDWGRHYGVHVNLNLHRAPGYCVNPPREPLDLWSDEEALEQFAFQWEMFAARYKGIPSSQLSFDLLNEPPDVPEETYARVVRRGVQGIRAIDPGRLIYADGLRWGTAPMFSLADLGIVQSTRGYQPMEISHYKASWIQGSENWSEPTWPLMNDKQDLWDKQLLREKMGPWRKIDAMGVAVHVGEWGAFNQTPHETALAWMRDCLSLWKEQGWGWSLWNLRGAFGVLDSQRRDVQYERYRRYKLDRRMLDVLRAG